MSKPPPNSLFEDRTLLFKGMAAEDIALDFLKSWAVIVDIEDVRNAQVWQEKDVDFKIRTKSGDELCIEVKSDKWLGQSENVLFELARIHHTAKPEHCAKLGWSVFSGADRFLIWSPTSQALYIFKSEELRRGMQDYVYDFRKDTSLSIVATDSRRTTLNILVPIIYTPYLVYAKRGQAWIEKGRYTAIKTKRKKAS